jgi:hypothetical protein
MGKWLSNLVTPLLVLFVASLITAVAKGPIDELANQNRLKAQVELAPWIDKAEAKVNSSDLADPTASIMSRVAQSKDSLGVARVNLENDSGQTVSDISFQFPAYSKTSAIMLDKDHNISDVSKLDQIDGPDMAPGDKVTFILWGTVSTYKIQEDFASYSSEGRFRTTFFWPENQGFESDDDFLAIVDGLIWIVGTVSAVLLLAILGIGWAQHSEYIKLLLTYSKAYRMEEARFWENPRKFSPDWNLINENHYKPHALLGEPTGKADPEEKLPETDENSGTSPAI